MDRLCRFSPQRVEVTAAEQNNSHRSWPFKTSALPITYPRSPLSCVSQSPRPPRTLSANQSFGSYITRGRELALVGTQFAPPHNQSRMPIGPPAFGSGLVSPAPHESGVPLALPVANRLALPEISLRSAPRTPGDLNCTSLALAMSSR